MKLKKTQDGKGGDEEMLNEQRGSGEAERRGKTLPANPDWEGSHDRRVQVHKWLILPPVQVKVM